MQTRGEKMNKKFNWGFWIIVSLILFAVGTFVLVFISMNTKVELVTDDYYEKELKYQQHIDIVKTTNALEGKVEFEFAEKQLTVTFPAVEKPEQYSGTIYFFRPSDKTKDFITEVNIDSKYSQKISTERLLPGLWHVKISWKAGAQEYYYEQPVVLQ